MSTQDQWPPKSEQASDEQQQGPLSSSKQNREGTEEVLKQEATGIPESEQQQGPLSSSKQSREGTEEVLKQETEDTSRSEQQKQ
jgi:hypothetical protein